MRTIGILLIITGAIALLASTVAFGDIGLSFAATAVTAVLTGIGFLIAAGPVNAIKASMRTAPTNGGPSVG